MTELLRQVGALIEQLPPEQQESTAERLQCELEEQEWEAIFAKSASERFLEHLAADAGREDAAGLTEESSDHW